MNDTAIQLKMLSLVNDPYSFSIAELDDLKIALRTRKRKRGGRDR